MKQIVSVSRRTDIPAHYGRWFERRIEAGFVGWVNPYYGQKYLVSLKRDDVAALVFWSKDYGRFIPVLSRLRDLGYSAIYNFSITGLPRVLEPYVTQPANAINTLIKLSRLFSPEHINWRYDPIVVTNITPPEYHLELFAAICKCLHGHVKRCYFSFPVNYGNGARNLKRLESEQGIKVLDLSQPERIALALRLAEIAATHGIEMFTCSGDHLIGGLIKKASCIDGDLISRLFYGGTWQGAKKPTRKECGCFASVDIGISDSCPHECSYCYANGNSRKIRERFTDQEYASPFLGYSKAEADEFIKEIEKSRRP